MSAFVQLREARLTSLVAAYGGELHGAAPSFESPLGRFVPLAQAGPGDLAPLLAARFFVQARAALARGAALLVQATLRTRVLAEVPEACLWSHAYPAWAMAKVLGERAIVDDVPPSLGEGVVVGAHVSLASRVTLGDRVSVGASSVLGSPGFGWATGPNGERLHVPQLGGVVIEDDVWIGPLVTIDAGTLGPTIIRRGVKLDAHVHVGHNGDIGEDTIVAAQCGFAGSVTIGKRVQVGGQVGIADHVTVGDDARLAAKSGVIGDVPAGAVFGGYPAVARARWLRGLGRLYRER